MRKILYAATAFAMMPLAGVSFADCHQGKEFGYVCELSGPEDMVALPGTQWIISGGLSSEKEAGKLYLIDRTDKRASILFPRTMLRSELQRQEYPTCPGLPDVGSFSAHGVNLRIDDAGLATLYVVNHGDREAIEVFHLVPGETGPEVAWVGCIPLPAKVMANAVAPLDDGRIAATHFIVPDYFDNADPSGGEWMAKLREGEVTGYAATWSAVSGWREISGTQASGPNGIEISRDGQWAWVAKWGNREIVRVPLTGADTPDVIALDFMPDNLRWGDDGMLWVAGAKGEPSAYFSCMAQPDCHNEFVVARIDPGTGDVSLVPLPPDLKGFGDATTAMIVDGQIWVGANPSDRVLYYSVD